MNRSNVLSALVALAALATPSAAWAEPVRNVVIVHGAFADGSGWRKVSDLLTAKGLHVTIVQQPLTSLSDDIAATRRILALQDGPIILVGHSYGGMVVTAAGDDTQEAGEPAWNTKPSWALVATQDRSINPDLERQMARRAGSTVLEVKASHAVYLSRPADVAALIVEAAATVPSR